MLRISQRCEYAIRAMLELALRRDRRPVSIAEIAQAQRLPAKFLAAILAQLKQAGLLESLRGTQGGYRLARQAHAISVGEVVRLMDGPMECTGATAAGAEATAAGEVLKEIRAAIKGAVEQVLDNMTFADLVEREMRRREILAATYCI
ncbi:MAG TPA: Rrf2 family transcriptional regulator [Phycisphaerae bacterium]|nr:Rrf2 family transcriptional regulator [Phycisphaerae bacterium]HPC21242.1 Rrf2 family transcriptional regulator [Phycisphaerae bacterium]HRS28321.1 Rrf2 family transcriptional regulator [Phycisphaerae bacterium]